MRLRHSHAKASANRRTQIDGAIRHFSRILRTFELILRKLSEGMAIEELLEAYPHITKEDILATVSYSADVIEREELLVS